MAHQIVCGCLTGFLSVPVAAVLELFDSESRGVHLPVILGVLTVIGVTVGPIIGSARIFSRPDRLRGYDTLPVIRRPPETRAWVSWLRLLWLSYTQMRSLLLGLSIFALALGFVLPLMGPVGWPFLTLFIGGLCGVTVCADEQIHGSFRFLGDQRFPLGRIWIVKVGMRFALTVLASFLLLLPSLILAIFRQEELHATAQSRPPFFADALHSSLVGTVVPVGLHLTMWLLYGFAVGHLCGLLFRKSLVAAVVTLGTAAMLASLWLPSLAGIGLHFWQVAGVPLIGLVTAWLLMPAWAAGRLLARGTFVGLGAAFAAATLWTVGGIWYRVVEVPDVPDQFDMPAFVAGLPTLEENEAGMKIRGAWKEVGLAVGQVISARAQKPLFPNAPPKPLFPNGGPPNEDPLSFQTQLNEILQHGWPGGQVELGDALDGAFAGNWYGQLADAARQPLGVVEDPRRHMIGTRLSAEWGYAGPLSEMLAVRALQRQAGGDHRAFVDNLRIALALSRNLRNHSSTLVARYGRAVEKSWIPALDRWLEKLPGHPELLKEVLALLAQHEAEAPDPNDAVKAAYLEAQNTLDVPGELLKLEIGPTRGEDAERVQAELNVASILWMFPWERERHRRILRVGFEGGQSERIEAVKWGGIIMRDLVGNRDRLVLHSPRNVAAWHAGRLKGALRLYQADTGKPAATLGVLVPRYLPAIPADPFDGKPFHYRLSRGERVGWVDEQQAVPPGGNPGPAAAAAPGMQPPGPMPGGAPMPPGGMMGGQPVPPGGMQGGPAIPGMPGAMPGPGMQGIPPPMRLIPKGQGILWSSGEDRHDDGGLRQGGDRQSGTVFGEDILYLVPLPPP